MTSEESTPLPSEMMTAAEAVLADALGEPVRLGAAERLGGTRFRSTVARYAVAAGPDTAPASVVVKCYRGEQEPPAAEAEDFWTPERRLLGEWSALTFLGRLPADPPLAPRLYGGDRQAAILVLEDLGQGPCLADVLQGTDEAAARRGLVTYAAGLGRLHAATSGRQAEFAGTRAGLGLAPAEDELQIGRWLREDVAAFGQACAALVVEPAAGWEAEIQAVAATLAEPGPWLAFAPGDTCPDNHRFIGESLRFFDFEFCSFRHALLDSSYLRVPFPTCWCVNRLPPDLVPALEATYRAELVRGCPAAADDAAFGRALVHACAYWMVVTLGWHLIQALTEDQPWGISSLRPRQRLRLDTFMAASETFGHLPALAATARALAGRLRERWPEADMPLYPPFRTS